MRLPDVSDGPIFSVLPEKIGEKRGAWMRLVHSASEFRRAPMFSSGVPLGGHLTRLYYAPPDTGVPNLQLVALERLPSIEGAAEILMDITLLRGSSWFAGTKRLPLGEAGPAEPGLMRAGEHWQIALQFHQNRHCSPALIRPCGALSPRGRHGDSRISMASPMRGSCQPSG